jgi:hypothetical protein
MVVVANGHISLKKIDWDLILVNIQPFRETRRLSLFLRVIVYCLFEPAIYYPSLQYVHVYVYVYT